MKKLTYSQTAGLLLIMALAALLAAFPFRQTFTGGLVTAMSSAGLIAGLADWFAVTALFRSPLGLPYPAFIPTAIVPRNRERLLEALVSMVEEELLNRETLHRHVTKTDLAGLLLDYARQPEVQMRLGQTLEQILDYLLNQFDSAAFRAQVASLVERHLEPGEFNGLLSELISISQAEGYDDKVLTLLMDGILHSLDYQELHPWLVKVLEGAVVRYSRGLTRRQVAGNLLVNAFSQGDSPRFGRQLRQAVNTQLSLLHRKIKLRLTLLAEELAGQAPGPAWAGKLSSFVVELLTDSPQVSPRILKGKILEKLQELWLDLGDNPAAREKLNNTLQNYLGELIETRHYLLGRLVRENLYQFDEQALTKFVEDKAGKDLQVIRISGTLVGSGAGALLYLVTFWLGVY
ncbi:MAG TPA: DUF445 domain-containing protein [Bacillota bacterium]|nr:DUF445 domain-containing protein [Bacillota bacterium]